MDATKITGHLWVGGWGAAQEGGFDRVVNCAGDLPGGFNLTDGPGNKEKDFSLAVEAVRSAIRSGDKTLVHCVAGFSRSVVVTATALSLETGGNFLSILNAMKIRRGCTPTRPFCPHEAMVELAQNYLKTKNPDIDIPPPAA